jgi:hypothetical protein
MHGLGLGHDGAVQSWNLCLMQYSRINTNASRADDDVKMEVEEVVVVRSAAAGAWLAGLAMEITDRFEV